MSSPGQKWNENAFYKGMQKTTAPSEKPFIE
jgi:hypothetical protein